MKKHSRYDTSALTEAQFEPGSRKRVLRNLLGVKKKREMDRLESKAQIRAMEKLITIYDRAHRFTASDVCRIHKIWLGDIYEWAGKYRQVNVSRDEFNFAAAAQVPKLMVELERGQLRDSTPCRFASRDEVVRAIASVHAELVLIHPFREGNGRAARLLAVLMALQAGLPPLDFGGIKGRKRREYFSAVQAGLDRNYEPMEKIFSGVIRRTLSERK